MMKKLFTFLLFVPILTISLFIYHSRPAAATFKANDLADDSIFDNASSMGAAQIDSWLNANFPSSCISTHNGFSAPDPTGYSPNPSQFLYSSSPVSAGTVIYDASQAYGINPQVLLATLQKEESLVDGGAGCSILRYTSAVGYGCTDSGTATHNYSYPSGGLITPLYYTNGNPVSSVSGSCVNSGPKAGFSEQIIHAAWLLTFGRHKSEGDTSWAVIKGTWNNCDDNNTCPAAWNIPASDACYGGPMTQGYLKRCPTDPSTTYYDGYTTIDGTSTHMDTGPTAALYWYTPHFNGNQSFVNIFTAWFGDPTTPCSAMANLTSTPSGRRIISYQYGSSGNTNLAFTQLNNTGSACAELHVWNSGYQSWLTHLATGMKATDPSQGMLVAMHSAGTTQSRLVYVVYSGSGGLVEVHKFSPDSKTFPGYYDIATNLSGVSATTGTFVAGDFLGRGYDQLAYVLYSGANGTVEVHLFDPTLGKAVGYYDVASNLGGVSATTGTFVAGDFLGRGYDQLAYVLYSGAGGNTEVHLFDQSLRKAVGFYDVPTNLGGVSTTTGTFVAGNFLGRGYDQLAYAMYNGTGSGMVEIHTFNQSLRQAIGFQDISTNLGSFDPSQ